MLRVTVKFGGEEVALDLQPTATVRCWLRAASRCL